ncbi:MAG: hypothetical protein JO046_06595 [Solirubrobacterales bacterium]|nr:hypothetical protein [Solirubrobacterales bacterium]
MAKDVRRPREPAAVERLVLIRKQEHDPLALVEEQLERVKHGRDPQQPTRRGQSNLVIRLREGAHDRCYWDAQWRYRIGRSSRGG